MSAELLRVAPRHESRHSCPLCPAGPHCLTADGTPAERIAWHDLQQQWISLPRAGKGLYALGDAATAVYVVRAGCLKTYTVDGDGHERVRNFFFPGDIVGLDALGSAAYPSHALSVSASQVCRITKGDLQRVLHAAPGVMQRLLERTSAELCRSLALSGDYSADQRVAAFLLSMQRRLSATADADDFDLPMTRRDIANHLRLATETVCRVLTRFVDAGWLDTADRHVRIRHREALGAQAEPVGLSPQRRAVRLAA